MRVRVCVFVPSLSSLSSWCLIQQYGENRVFIRLAKLRFVWLPFAEIRALQTSWLLAFSWAAYIFKFSCRLSAFFPVFRSASSLSGRQILNFLLFVCFLSCIQASFRLAWHTNSRISAVCLLLALLTSPSWWNGRETGSENRERHIRASENKENKISRIK